jgi:Leucine-rich repeat (LRR) protein
LPFPPLHAQWVKKAQSLPPEEQVQEVAAELKRRNAGFDPKKASTYHKVEGGVVAELGFLTDDVTDISPVRALSGLRRLSCYGSAMRKGKLANLSPLKGMLLVELNCSHCQVTDLLPLMGMPLRNLDCAYNGQLHDLSPLKDTKLTSLNCNGTRVSDLSPLKGMSLEDLIVANTPVSDLKPLAGMRLTSLEIPGTPVTDLSPLRGMPLTRLACNQTNIADLSPLQGMKTLTWLHC